MPAATDTIILSDIHLGSRTSRAREALEMLKAHTFKRLVLLGDIFDDLNFHRLKQDHWNLLSYIRELSNPTRAIEVVWVVGNHDHMLLDVGHLLGVPVVREYEWEEGGRRHLAIHGDQFDRLLVRNNSLSRMSSRLYAGVQRLGGKQRIARAIKRTSKKVLRLSRRVSRGALEHGKRRGVDIVLCGHTHAAMKLEKDGVTYLNTGSWTDSPATYITIAGGKHDLHSIA